MPAQLSGGQQQRVALARAAVYDPPLLLMDEPLGALDKNLREDMQEELRQFHRGVGATILYVTHDQQEAASMADRMAIMNLGVIEQVGPPLELYERPRNSFVARFLGEANLFGIVHTEPLPQGRLRLATVEGPVLLACAPADGTVACLRPENVTIAAAAPERGNCFPGRIVDIVHVAGSIRYRVEIAANCAVTVRAASERRTPVLPMGGAVHVAWDAEDVIVLPS
jgi:putative spermidine/putrescine transport system ATP-binding protein